MPDATAARTPGADTDALVPLTAIGASHWRGLSERAIEPNGYYLPEWEFSVNASASGRTGASALVGVERCAA